MTARRQRTATTTRPAALTRLLQKREKTRRQEPPSDAGLSLAVHCRSSTSPELTYVSRCCAPSEPGSAAPAATEPVAGHSLPPSEAYMTCTMLTVPCYPPGRRRPAGARRASPDPGLQLLASPIPDHDA